MQDTKWYKIQHGTRDKYKQGKTWYNVQHVNMLKHGKITFKNECKHYVIQT